MRPAAVPDALHLCDRCGSLASGACEACVTIDVAARGKAAELVAEGVQRIEWGPLGADPDRWKCEIAVMAAVEAELARMRAARLYGSLPRVGEAATALPGAAVQRAQPSVAQRALNVATALVALVVYAMAGGWALIHAIRGLIRAGLWLHGVLG